MDEQNPPGSETGHCPCPLGNCAGNAPPEWHEACDRGIQEADLGKIDCWVRTEFLKDDIQECMDKFSARGGLIGEPVKLGKAYSSPKHDRKKCMNMFHPKLAKFVYEGIDASFVKRFGYSSC